MNIYGIPNMRMINSTTGTIVETTGLHGDKTMKFQFEAYLIENNEKVGEPQLFQKQPFIAYEE